MKKIVFIFGLFFAIVTSQAHANNKSYVMALLFGKEGAWTNTNFAIHHPTQQGPWCAEHSTALMHAADQYQNLGVRHAKTIENFLNNDIGKHCKILESLDIKAMVTTPAGNTERKFGRAKKQNGRWTVSMDPQWKPINPKVPVKELNVMDVFTAAQHGAGAAIDTAAALSDQVTVKEKKAKFARQQKYAAEGLFCEAKAHVKYCFVETYTDTSYMGRAGRLHTTTNKSSCSSPCDGVTGICNTKTGKRYADWEQAERENCRAITATEKEKFTPKQVSLDVKNAQAMPYTVRMMSW